MGWHTYKLTGTRFPLGIVRCLGIALIVEAGTWSSPAQVVPPLSEIEGQERLINLNFRDSPLDQVLIFYSELTGRTMIKAPGVSATISIRGQTRMTEREALQAIESVLAMHNVALVPMGDRFLRVVQPTAVRQEGMPILQERPEEPLPETDQIFSMILNLKHMEIAEVQPILQQLIHGYGKIQPLERTNSLMITDTASNLNRILEILDYIDRPVELREDIFVRRILHAQAGEVASRLNEFIQDKQTEERPRVAPPTEMPRAPPGVIRPGRTDGAPSPAGVAATAGDAAAELAERGIVQGRVKIVADERINTLFIISRPANFTFFDRIIDILDQPVDPEIIVRVINLEYALAEEIAGILNEFVGAASSDSATRTASVGEETGGGRAEALRDFAAGLARDRSQAAAPAAGAEATKIGRLSANTKILSDQRSNALLLMGRRNDIAALEEVIAQLDIMLGQVLIEAVIIEISLGKNIESGVDWLQRTLTAYSEQRAGPRGGVTLREPVLAFGGGSAAGGLMDSLGTIREGLESGVPPVPSGGLSYYLTFFDLNLDAVIRLAASSRDARILSTPVILTTDNTEAKIVVGESRPVVTSTSASTVGDRQVSNYQFRDIGINLTVTPRINPQRFVVMDISQSADNVGGFEIIDNNRVPIITKREMQAQIAVKSRSTIVLGGLVNTDRIMSTSKVPLLGDIPILGRLFRTDTTEDTRTELLVLITPYVMMSPEEARSESERLHSHSHSSRTQWHTGWSDSEFAVKEDVDRPFFARNRNRSDAVSEEENKPSMTPRIYDRDAMRDVLRSLNEEPESPAPAPQAVEPVEEDSPVEEKPVVQVEPSVQKDPSVQEDPAGMIQWRDVDPEPIPATVPRSESPSPASRPVPRSELPAPDSRPVLRPEAVEDITLPPPVRWDDPVPLR